MMMMMISSKVCRLQDFEFLPSTNNCYCFCFHLYFCFANDESVISDFQKLLVKRLFSGIITNNVVSLVNICHLVYIISLLQYMRSLVGSWIHKATWTVKSSVKTTNDAREKHFRGSIT